MLHKFSDFASARHFHNLRNRFQNDEKISNQFHHLNFENVKIFSLENTINLPVFMVLISL